MALSRYSQTRAEEDYRKFQKAIAVPLGDRAARLALSRENPDVPAARAGLIAGQTDVADLGPVIFLFRWGRWFGPMKHAVELWTRGDAYVVEIERIGRQMHDAATSHLGASDDRRALAVRLREIDEVLTPLEDEFSATLGEGARQVQRLLLLVLVGTAGGLTALAFAVFRNHRAERARYESTLRVSEARYRSVFESSIDSIIIASPEGAILEANPAATRLFGHSSAELAALGIRALIDENSESVREQFFRGLAAGHFQGALEFRKKDETRFVGEVSCAMFTDLHGQKRTSVAVRDVTEKTRLLQSVIRSEQRMDLALEGADLGMWDFDISSGKFAGNARLSSMIGFAPGEIELDTYAFESKLHPDDLARFAAAFYGHLKGEIPSYEAEYRLRHKEGQWVWILSRGKVVQRNEDGRALRIVGTNKDVTTRKVAEENEKRLRRAFQLLSRCDSVLVHADEQSELLAQICQLTVEIGGHLMAWVGSATKDSGERAIALAHAGSEEGYLTSGSVVGEYAESRQEPVVAAIRSKATIVVQDISESAESAPWRDAARLRGFRSCIALPLIVRREVIGAFAIYSGEPFAFHQHEVQLLEQLAADLSYGIQTLQSRQEHEEDRIVLKRESEKNQALLRNASDGIHILDASGRLLEASDSFCSMLGYARDEMIGMHVSDWDASLSSAEIAEKIRRQFVHKNRHQFETRHRRSDGTTIDVEVSGVSIELDGGPVLFNSSREITERKRTEDSLRDSEERLRAVIEQSPIGVAFARDGIIVDANAVYVRMFGYEDAAQLRGRKLLDQVAPQGRSAAEDRGAADQVEGGYETVGLRKDGSEFPVYVSAKRLLFKDGPSTIAFVIDITRQKISEEEIRRLAFFDHLTDLPNRRLLKDRLQQALLSSERTGRRGALLFIDLDDFKSLNDTLGHAAGDALLQEVARRLQSCLRESDSIARMGGDEFVV
ncbi:MAG TPA: PAS domain S-box protein, partial [Burkholderiaceae bacterium]|nr:PAS domain S-box protein [Burkholderiaceae bacterium]